MRPELSLRAPGVGSFGVPRLIHLNGLPRVGKSSLARRYGDDLPQLVTSHDRDLRFDAVARAADAHYLEVVLDADPGSHGQRLQQKRPTTDVEAHIQVLLTDPEGDLLDRTRRHLAEYLAHRPHALRLDTTDLTEEQAYALLLRTIG